MRNIQASRLQLRMNDVVCEGVAVSEGETDGVIEALCEDEDDRDAL